MGLGAISSAVVAVLLLLIAVLLVLGKGKVPLPRRRGAADSAADTGPTLSESLAQAPLAVTASERTDDTAAATPPPAVPGETVAAEIFRAAWSAAS